MPQPHLNLDILEKMAAKSGKSKQYLREQISRKAGRSGIASISAQLIWARQLGIGTTHALNKLPTEIREEIRSANTSSNAAPAKSVEVAHNSKPKARPITAATIKALLHDTQLCARCKDLIQAKKHFDRVIREATTVLDDRLKTKTGITNMNPANLVGKVLSPDPLKAVIEVSADKSVQEGFHSICKGVMLAFRDKAHHSLTDKFTREDALKFCGFIDTLLGVIEAAILHKDRV